MEKMMVRCCVGVEVSSCGIDNNLSKQTRVGELVQSIVDCCQRHTDVFVFSLLVQRFSCQVPIGTLEKKFADGDPLRRGPQTVRSQFGDKFILVHRLS